MDRSHLRYDGLLRIDSGEIIIGEDQSLTLEVRE